MRLLSFRLIVSLILSVTLVSFGFSYYQVSVEKRALRSELERRAEQLGESLASNVERVWDAAAGRHREATNNLEPPHDLERLVERFGNREHLIGVAVYDRDNKQLAITSGLRSLLTSPPSLLGTAITKNQNQDEFTKIGNTHVHVLVVPLQREGEVVGGLAVVHDAEYIRAQMTRVWYETFLRAVTLVVMIVLITLLIVRWSITGPIARAAQWVRAMHTGKITTRHELPDMDLFHPLTREVATIAESLRRARKAAEYEARLRDAGDAHWTAERLAVQVRSRLAGSRLFAVSNREPYSHQRDGKTVKVGVPPSGLVTALEPVLTACDGTWIAHGSGNADREFVDEKDRLRVPPEDPHYTVRRVWLTKEEEDGYYYGFSNEGLWPLCHVAHTRPIFRAEDWKMYQEVNRKFMEALLEETADTPEPVVLIQDYHFALLPQMFKEKRPDARVAIFWHIPWPNPEAFGICPWQRQIVEGLLGADLIGFHIQSHCNNFLETVDQVVESRVDWERFSVLRNGHRTMVRPFPISVDWNEGATGGFSYEDRAELLRTLGVEATLLGVGVDRVDYTKGILERFLAIERFLEKYPEYQNKFTFVQIGAPSRTHIKRYHDLFAEVEAEAERINKRFQAEKWKPIALLTRQHSHKEILPYYRAADLCMVTSLHDGMNLVAKEFVAARQDDGGVLILSQFTGAARELRDALLVNPYDIDRTADVIRTALEMDVDEKKLRMQRMRKVIRDNNIYRWAANLIAELCEVRLDEAPAHGTEEQTRDAISAA